MNPWQDRLLWLSVITLFIGVPLSIALSSIGMGLLGISSIILVSQRGFPKPINRFKPLVGLGIFFLFFLISGLYSSPIIGGLNDALRQHAFLTIPLCFWAISEWIRPKLKFLVQLFIASCTFHCLLTIGLLILPETLVSEISEQITILRPYPELTDRLKFGLYTPFLERLSLAYLIGFALLYLLYDALYNNCYWHHWIQGIILLTAFILIGARGAQLAFLAALLFGILSGLKDRLKSQGLSPIEYQQKLTSAITIIVIVAFAIPYITYKTVPAIQKRYDQLQWELRLINNGDYVKEEYQYFTSLARIRSINNAATVIKDHPCLGSGIGDYTAAMKKANASYNDKVSVHNQNFFLYIWGASGILALVTFIYGLWNYTKSFWRYNIKGIRHLALAYVFFICVSSMIDAFLKYHIGNTSVMLFLSTLFLLNIPYRRNVA